MKVFITIAMLVFAGSNLFAQKIIVVDQAGGSGYTTISDGINAAANGDTIKVMPGLYSEQININKSVCIAAKDTNVIIASPKSQTIAFTSGSGGSSLFGFKISSDITYASGIDNTTISSNIFESSSLTANIGSAGILIKNNTFRSSALIVTNQTKKIYISGNNFQYSELKTSSDKLGVIVLYGNNFISSNNGIYVTNTKESKGYIYSNTMKMYGSSELYVNLNSSIIGNDMNIQSAHGITLNGSGNIDNIRIIGNKIWTEGNNSFLPVYITNTASNYYLSRLAVLNNILIGQRADGFGSSYGIYFRSIPDSIDAQIKNNVFRNFYYTYYNVPSKGNVQISNNIFINCNNNIFNGQITSFNYNCQYNVNYYMNGLSNIFVNPQFVDVDDYHLNSGSPCINAGSTALFDCDLDRTRNDMGIYGGSYNWDNYHGTNAGPQVLELNLSPQATKQGTTINISGSGVAK